MTEQLPNTNFPFEKDHVNAWALQTKLFTQDECQEIINYGNNFKKNFSTIANEKNPANENIRKCNIAWIYPNQETYQIFERLSQTIKNLNEEFFKFDITGMQEGLQFTEYNAPSDHYIAHQDLNFGNQIRKLSAVVQLTNPNNYEGGNLLIYGQENPDVLNNEQGSLILFPSYMLHKVTPITKGTRYSLVSWITGPNFK
jgi:PKHD-type hydroxylase